MKVTAVSALHHMSRNVHMNVSIRDLTANRTATSNAIGNMTQTRVDLGPTAAARLLKGNDADVFLSLTPSSSASISAQRSHVNLLSEPDAVAQEMSHNLRPSMSQSGDSDHDITMPDNPLGESASEIANRKLRDVPQSLQALQDRFDHEPPTLNEWIELETELTANTEYPVVPPERNNEPALEVAVTAPPTEFIYVPNRLGERLPNTLPNDIPYTENPTILEELSAITQTPQLDDAFQLDMNRFNDTPLESQEQEQQSANQLEQLMDDPSMSFVETKARNWDTVDLEAEHQQQVIQHPSTETPEHLRMVESLLSQLDLSIHK